MLLYVTQTIERTYEVEVTEAEILAAASAQGLDVSEGFRQILESLTSPTYAGELVLSTLAKGVDEEDTSESWEVTDWEE